MNEVAVLVAVLVKLNNKSDYSKGWRRQEGRLTRDIIAQILRLFFTNRLSKWGGHSSDRAAQKVRAHQQRPTDDPHCLV